MENDLLELANHTLTSEQKLQEWGVGEWVEEPDDLEFEHKGYKCLVQRKSKWGGHFCGYIQIPKGHPWFQKDDEEIDCDVHGGLTFSEWYGEKWHLIGFDCAHMQDLCPGIDAMYNFYGALTELSNLYKKLIKPYKRTYKNIHFVIDELKKLVDQAIEAENGSTIDNG